MYLAEAIKSFFDYHRINSKKNTVRNYEMILKRFHEHFGDREVISFNSEEILDFLSKVILRHTNLSTTQRYLGKVTGIEAMRWIDNLHG